MMKRMFWVMCGLLALCAAGHTSVYAEEIPVDDIVVDYVDENDVIDVPDDLSGFVDEFPPEDPLPDDPDDSIGHFVEGDGDDLSRDFLDMLDRLGYLLDYDPSVSANDIGDPFNNDPVDGFESGGFSGDGVYDILSSMDSSLSTLSDISLYSDFTAFNGAISSTYLDLFRGFLPKLSYKEHYVLYRESQYIYSFVFGEDLSFSGSTFNGTNLTRVYFNAYNTGTYGHSVESSFSLNPGSTVVYTDLGTYYPALSTDTGSQLIQIKWVLFVTVLTLWMSSLYKGIRRRGDRDKHWASANTV